MLVLWKDFAIEDSTWEEVGSVDEGAVKVFFKLFPGKPGKAIAAASFGWGMRKKLLGRLHGRMLALDPALDLV